MRVLALALDVKFQRIQFTPDLMPSDITGTDVLEEDHTTGKRTFRFVQGPIFSNLILADEINRTPPKTQSALLEAMQEHRVTIQGRTYTLDEPFFVFATQNPIELEGTYPLPEAQLDRFLMRLRVGYPTPEDEQEILERRLQRRRDAAQVSAVTTRTELPAMQEALEDVFVSKTIEQYVVALVQATRQDRRVQIGASPRGSLALLKLARTYAALRGRDFVTPDDVKAMAVPALAHRLILQPELWVTKVTEDEIIRDLLHKVPTPKTED